MPKNNPKTLWTVLICIQVMRALLIPMALAAPDGGQNDQKDKTPKTDSSSFNVTTFLSAPGQEQKYLTSNAPIASFIVQIVNFLVLTVGSLCFLVLVVGGFTLLASHGAEAMVTKGKDMIKFALIGLVIVLTAYFITAFVQSLFYEIPGK